MLLMQQGFLIARRAQERIESGMHQDMDRHVQTNPCKVEPDQRNYPAGFDVPTFTVIHSKNLHLAECMASENQYRLPWPAIHRWRMCTTEKTKPELPGFLGNIPCRIQQRRQSRGS
eukprot:scaffold128_cov328-Pavlova_lutheri.AAC.46